jgi:tRNA (adenine22-N1)-methyltransferase
MTARIALSERLQAVVDMVPFCAVAADIGCDHGKAAAALLLCGKAARAVCADISAPSLDKARNLSREYGLEAAMSLRAGDGLSVLAPGEADAAVIAGMGGLLIADILKAGISSAPDTLVLSPNRDAAVLRGALAALGYRIDDEALVCEGGHYYPVIRAMRGQSPQLTAAELEFGPVLLKNRPEVLRRFVQRRVQETRVVRERVAGSESPRRELLLAQADGRLAYYEEVLKCL